jgi:hypothetical protein
LTAIGLKGSPQRGSVFVKNREAEPLLLSSWNAFGEEMAIGDVVIRCVGLRGIRQRDAAVEPRQQYESDRRQGEVKSHNQKLNWLMVLPGSQAKLPRTKPLSTNRGARGRLTIGRVYAEVGYE